MIVGHVRRDQHPLADRARRLPARRDRVTAAAGYDKFRTLAAQKLADLRLDQTQGPSVGLPDFRRGMPITDYCDQNHLTPRERLELFVNVCQAVQHAHQKGVIHRDLKPSNVLVTVHDTRPVVKVIDFGVAKAMGQELTDKTLFTGFAQMIGTPLYMSPEQAGQSGLDIDTRSDIYSLGVLLYELLTGSTPFDKQRFKKAAYDEIRRIIREEEPPKPSTRLSGTDELPSVAANRGVEPKKLSGLVRGELDWIVMKALDKDRNRRYETPNGFAMDIQRYLNDEHVLACPPSASHRLRKFARRNRAALATVGLVAAALIMGVAISLWQAIRATTAERLASTRLVAETQARGEAEQARDGEAKQREAAQKSAHEAESQREKAQQNFGRRLQWQQARAPLDKLVELDPSDHFGWYNKVTVELGAEDHAAYRDTCREILARFANDDGPRIATRTARVCLLVPGAVDDPSPILNMVERAKQVSENLSPSQRSWDLGLFGLNADFRRAKSPNIRE